VKVIHATAWYPPYEMGGTEIYVSGLVESLSDRGVESVVLRPGRKGMPRFERYGRARVYTYAINEVPSYPELRRRVPHEGFSEFAELLKENRDAIYHQHSWARGCDLHHLVAAKELGLKTVVTAHIPGNICLRGTMMHRGQRPCDGVLEDRKCGACWLQDRGAPLPLALGLAHLPLPIAEQMLRINSRTGTALGTRALAASKRADLKGMIESADSVVAPCEWMRQSLVMNGCAPEKLVLSRQGISAELAPALKAARESRASSKKGRLRLLCLGRWEPLKGIDHLVRAMLLLPEHVPAELTVHMVEPGPDHCGYARDTQLLARGDRRIRFAQAVPRDKLAEVMLQHDVLCVPSVCLETGPLVALEAQAAGLFVLGSNVGGIAELVRDGDGGELAEAGNPAAWARAIERLAKLHAERGLPQCGLPVRTMDAVASDMATLYGSLRVDGIAASLN